MNGEKRFDLIRLEGLVVDCVVGVYPSERDQPQPLELDLTLALDTRAASEGAGLSASVDYARVFGEVRFLLERGRFLLLESAAEALARMLLSPPTPDAPRAQIEEVAVRLAKPMALGHVKPSLEVRRRRDEVRYPRRQVPTGEVERLYETPGCGVYRRHLSPGARFGPRASTRTDKHALVLGDRLRVQDRELLAGVGVRFDEGQPFAFDNPSDATQTVLCVDRPGLDVDEDHAPTLDDEPLRLPPIEHHYPEADRARLGTPR